MNVRLWSRSLPVAMLMVTAATMARAQAGGAGVLYSKHDEFRGLTTMTWDSTFVGPFQFYAIRVVGDRTALLSFWKQNSTWQYLDCHDAAFLADSTRLHPATPARHEGHIGSGYVLEFVNVELSVESMRLLSAATRARGRICNDEFTFTSGQQRLMLELAGKVERAPVQLTGDTAVPRARRPAPERKPRP